MRQRYTIVSLLLFLVTIVAQAQITIGGNVYGGGNAGDTGGSTTVTVRAGDISAVYGGARMANVDGSSFVNIDGAHASDDILIANVYGGNDISGTVGQSEVATTVPTALDNFKKAGANVIDNSWKTFIRTSPCGEKHSATIEGESVSADKYMAVVGTLYGGGNGDYVYKDANGSDLKSGDNFIVRDAEGNTVATSKTSFNKPELAKTYLELKGGCIAHVYGGGNAATVTGNTTINIDNSSDDLQKAATVWKAVNHPEESLADVFNYLLSKVKINTTQSDLSSLAFNFARVFGGNNKADMAIRPNWNLQRGIIRDLYSGGNEGRMTSPEGLLLQIEGAGMTVQNVYGGCRKADVRPLYNNNDNTPVAYDDIQLTDDDNPNNIPAGYAARVRILGGHVTNVYGGNDISGNVYGGNTVGILTHIYGNVYGGGNGSYAYTDNPKLKDDPEWRDFYYDPDKILQEAGITGVADTLKSAEALNIYRPNAEKVSILVRGTAANPVTVDGALYVGGNSASLREQAATGSSNSRQTHIKIGSYVTIDNVFLGNNGENMIKSNGPDASGNGEGVLYTMVRTDIASDQTKFNSMNLKDKDVFAKYMEGCAMKVKPSVVFDNYEPYTTQFGSFFCGGNVGSILVDGKITVPFEDKVIIYDKVVGGCNNANVDATDINAEYLGGMLGSPEPVPAGSPEGTIGDKLELNFAGLKIQPKRWNEGHTALIWNTVSAETGEEVNPTNLTTGTSTDVDKDRRLLGGNVYGGCYNTGHVNGNVVINIDQTLVDRKGQYSVFDETTESNGEAVLDDDDQYTITQRHSGVILDPQGDDVLGNALNVFGGGYGPESEIWGSTTVNVNAGYAFQVFGGGEQGPVGKSDANGTYTYNYTIGGVAKSKKYTYNPAYSCYVNLRGKSEGIERSPDADDDMAEVEYLYAGAFEAPIAGNTVVSLGNGRVYQSFGGSCNADILGHTETYVGRQANADGTYTDGGGFPWVRDNVFGGNDLGGRVMNAANFIGRVRTGIQNKVYNPLGKTITSGGTSTPNPDVTNASAYMEYQKGRVNNIFGGCYGDYDYADRHFEKYTNADGSEKAGFTKPRMNNAFVNFNPTYHARNAVAKVFGAGQGESEGLGVDLMQDRSYVLIDIPVSSTTVQKFTGMEVFGSGANCGLGMGVNPSLLGSDPDKASAVIDLMSGQIGAAYGASYKDGVTRRTMVNVPSGSTIKLGSIFGGAYGTKTLLPCDVYEANVGYHSADACLIYNPVRTVTETDPDTGVTTTKQLGDEKMKGAIYGGNNHERRSVYAKITIDAPVNQEHYQYGMTKGYVYGAGYGERTWAEYTEINLNDGADVYEVYGGGEAGRVLNAESVQAYMNNYWGTEGASSVTDPKWKAAWTLGGGLDPETFTFSENSTSYLNNAKTNLTNALARTAEMDDRTTPTYKYNTNVLIRRGATVENYAYGGGLGVAGKDGSGDVYGSTYIALLGGKVKKDLYAAGKRGGVYNAFRTDNFIATANAYVCGGTVRNAYGGGYMGSVGYHAGEISAATTDDIDGETHVVIGIRKDQTDAKKLSALQKVKAGATLADYGFYIGVPTVQRNAYGGGEGETEKGGRGGAVYGTANLTLNNGYIGYVFLHDDETLDSQDNITKGSSTGKGDRYVEKLNDETYFDNKVWKGKGRLKDCGNIFGGGYSDRSNVDHTNVTMWGGTVRNSLHGGAEIAAVGRGSTQESGEDNSTRVFKAIYKPGSTKVTMYNGHVLRNVFGGGKGYNILGYGGANELYTDGYVFGKTEVFIHGGEIGTEEGVAIQEDGTGGYGNVFGGGDIGYVYSPSITSTKTKQNISTGSPGHRYYYDATGKLTEDCKVVIAPWLQVRAASATVNGKTKSQYEYFETEDLNTLPKSKDNNGNWIGEWAKLFTGDYLNGHVNPDDPVERGIHIYNAVFGGGNVTSNASHYADLPTVYGNTTATLCDIYHRDFITVGTEHTGGLYGGGNRSLVNGYRELNITNYGTDYYGLKQTISIDEYRGLSNRERAYFQLEYKCTANSESKVIDNQTYYGITIDNVFYKYDQRLKEEEYLKLANSENTTISGQAKSSFEPYGFCSIYAGRLLNTIQRADLCGVFGSRMVLQGAKDRVAAVGEDIPYTINRVGELSLNQQRTKITTDTGDDALHGNYFGIYSLVNYLGNMTSDIHFSDPYVNVNGAVESGKSYYSHKSGNPTSSDRNKGKSVNQVALASGVFLELTTEKTETNPNKKKEYGYVTGVIELDLINVKKEQVGGGFVYAKNEHRVSRYYPSKDNVILSSYNKQQSNEAITYKRYRYDKNDNSADWPGEDEAITLGHGDNDHTKGDFGETRSWQTSGNFIHHEKRIVDDCYPTNNSYIIGSANYSEAHYWYVKGDVYIYDQKLSAYTGSANAYSKEVHLPLTITAASNGKLQLLNVKPNLYAYYTDKDGTRVKIGTNGSDGKPIDKVTVNNESDTYKLNDVISWWDWHQMTAGDRQYFVTQTYLNCVTVTVTENGSSKEYAPGTYVMDDTDFNAFKNKFNNHTITIKDAKGADVETVGDVFRSSNNIGHDTGYVLTFDMNTPKVWDDYYTSYEGTAKKTKAEYEALFTDDMTDAQKQAVLEAWRVGPTFTPTTSGIYGKRQYKIGDVITEETYKNAAEGKTNMDRAYVAKETVSYTYNGTPKTVNPGTPIPKSEWSGLSPTQKESFDSAWYCKTTIKLSNESYLLYGELKYKDEIDQLKTTYSSLASDIESALTPAYICTANGEYGGQQYDKGKNYSAIQTWCSLTNTDRQHFDYNYDALDLLTNSAYLAVDPNVTTSPSHEATVAAFHSPYTDQVPVEYQAVFKKNGVDVAYNGSNLADGAVLTNQQFETIRNDKRHYTYVKTTVVNEPVYIAKNNFVYLGTPYGKGQTVDLDVYTHNTSDVETVTIDSPGEWYYCFEAYTTKEGAQVAKGTKKTKSEYDVVPNDQQYFIIQGKEPTETTTLYVSRESNAHDVMSEKIITVVYQYTYYEDEDDGSVQMTNELHVVNIHLQLESGAPTIGELTPPPTVLPGTAVGLSLPDVNPGLYEVLTNGWELFTTPDDAVNHRNGVPFTNNGTKVYWYQNQKNWVAFYSMTYLGKTYSNSVPLSVANYHDLDDVMQDKDHHMYVDRTDVDRECKIYIDNRNCLSDPSKSELDLLKDFYDLSLQSAKITTVGAATKDHEPLDSHVRAGRNLEFILSSDVSPKAYTTWNPIGNNSTTGDSGQCFQGNLHGDGYTVSGLSNSLFGHLCGEVYNLGVTGSFTGAGVAETGGGYVENCWVKTTGTPVKTSGETHYAVFGNPSRAVGDTRGQVQVENCYYPESNDYQVPPATGYAHGKPIRMADKDFYNGTVAYNLNGFYLKKRYYHGTGLTEGTEYKYLQPNADGTLPDDMSIGYYPNDYAVYQPHIKMAEDETVPYKGTHAPYMGYVENRFYDGDYRYAGNGSNDIRMRAVTTTTGTGDQAVETTTMYYVPVWPDDYIFFGQALTYDTEGNQAHQVYPSHINKTNERTDVSVNGNRVYRAPAYFRSNNMKVAHFNPNAVFAKTKKNDASVLAFKDMTAIDFTGGNGDLDGGFKNGWNGNYFFQPLLDDDGLTSFQNVDLTRNLLVYTNAGTKTDGAVGSYLGEDYPYSETNETYHNVAPWDRNSDKVRGHWVQKTVNGYIAPNDHLLLDEQDFNCPIGYSFKESTTTEEGSRMWYQREPGNFVDGNKGWETVSIPFEAEMVTTSDKGEITHFYGGSTTGHEYWLREYKGGNVNGNILNANFAKPDADRDAEAKHYSNTFLWDYYYSHDDNRHEQVDEDRNGDEYQLQYYSTSHDYPNYPRVGAGVPYLIGFPGKNYYEFDLSGEWTPQDHYEDPYTIESKGKQTITFVSKKGAEIKVSDGETGHKTVDGFTFRANYLNSPTNTGTNSNAFLLDGDGDSFGKTTAAALNVKAFRPYFIQGAANARRAKSTGTAVDKIIFGEDASKMGMIDLSDPRKGEVGQAVYISAKEDYIVVESALKCATDIRIINTAGILMRKFTLEPGETREVRMNNGGVYIVKTADGRYRKKLAVK